jgi:uncharacterized protein YbjT (DUF2867 family)
MRLARLLRARGYAVRSLIRRPAEAGDVLAAGAEPVVCDLESATETAGAEAVGAGDAVVFAAGAGPGSGPERKWTVDYGGAVKLMAAARTNGIRRYVMVSTMGADPDRDGDDTFSVYLRAKGQAEVELRASGLGYTIVRPGRLTDEPATGRVQLAPSVPDGEISRDDVAAVLAVVLDEPAIAVETFAVIAGDVPIDDAVRSLVVRR